MFIIRNGLHHEERVVFFTTLNKPETAMKTRKGCINLEAV